MIKAITSSRYILSIALLTGIAVGSAPAWAQTTDASATAPVVTPPLPEPAAAPKAAAADPVADTITDISIGQVDAKVKITEYASFTCSHCKNFHDTVWSKLKADYIDTGKVQFTLREVYFDRYGLWAAMIARCGGEMRYYGIVDILYDTQADWVASDNPATVSESLKKIGRTAGMDDTTLDACMQDKTKAQALITHFEKNSAADGVEGTPTFFINGTKHSNMAYDDMKGLIEAELAK